MGEGHSSLASVFCLIAIKLLVVKVSKGYRISTRDYSSIFNFPFIISAVLGSHAVHLQSHATFSPWNNF